MCTFIFICVVFIIVGLLYQIFHKPKPIFKNINADQVYSDLREEFPDEFGDGDDLS